MRERTLHVVITLLTVITVGGMVLGLVNDVSAQRSLADVKPFTAYESGGNCVYIAGYGSTATIAVVRKTTDGC